MNAKLPWTDYHSTGEDEDGYDHKCKWSWWWFYRWWWWWSLVIGQTESGRVKHSQTWSNMVKHGQAKSCMVYTWLYQAWSSIVTHDDDHLCVVKHSLKSLLRAVCHLCLLDYLGDQPLTFWSDQNYDQSFWWIPMMIIAKVIIKMTKNEEMNNGLREGDQFV